MPEFKRSRLERKSDEQITRKTIMLGFLTILFFVLIVLFGLPFLVRFSIFLGETKNKKGTDTTEKVLPPLPPRLELPFEATNSSQIAIKGYAEASTTVELLKNDVSVGKTEVSTSGEFNFDQITLDKGDNVFSAVALTEKGGSSEASKTVTVNYDDTPPALTMTNPSEEALTVDYSDFDVAGTTDKGANVTINGHLARVDDSGNFKLKFQLTSGKNDIEIVARDEAGNETR
ncbi:MAG TPA: hypothetical protein VF810_01500, partial [Patescibacteria group bacterium]